MRDPDPAAHTDVSAGASAGGRGQAPPLHPEAAPRPHEPATQSTIDLSTAPDVGAGHAPALRRHEPATQSTIDLSTAPDVGAGLVPALRRREHAAHSARGADGDLVTHVATFAAALRARGVAATLSDEADALEALGLVDLGDRNEVRLALAAALKVRLADRATFAELFDRFWRATPALAPRAEHGPAGKVMARSTTQARAVPSAPAGGDDASATTRQHAGELRQDRPGYSPEALLRAKPFDACTAEELAAMERFLARLALRVATRPSRRRVATRGRGEVDLRRSFRRMLAHGGEILTPARRRRAVERPRWVALCDTSGSMDPHARIVLSFLLALRGVEPTSEVFVFNTTLVRLSGFLRPARRAGAEPVARTLQRLATAVPDWSGGTKIGECLRTFVDLHLERLVDSRTIVLVLSDGLDRGDVEPLRGAMRAIGRRARRVLWLNPLAGDPRYEATARAMAAALPYVDHLLPAHDLASLERLLPLLAA